MSSIWLIIIIVAYLGGLFLVAFRAEKRRASRWVNNPYVYTLSLAVYCSAWTYYGSVGKAASEGIDFLTIYLGPIIAMPLWIVVMRKIIRISRNHNVSSIADFISLRYGKNRSLGAIVTLVCLLATIPYISLQLKAISDTSHILTTGEAFDSSKNMLFDSTFYIAIILALFATFFGTQTSDATEKHKGIIATVAVESVIKLVFFLIVGIYVAFVVYDSPQAIFEAVEKNENIDKLIRFGGVENAFSWMFLIILSFLAMFLLPRQFQVAVVENNREKHLKKAIWLFPLYLLLFNIFVIYIAWGGNILYGDSSNAEYYSLLLPLDNGNTFLSLLVFLGGFSAVISMVVVSTLALSTMVSNNLIIPYGFLSRFQKGQTEKNTKAIKNIRRFSIFFIIALSYFFFASFSVQIPLISIGLMAFVIIAQLAPSFFIGLYWNRGSGRAAIIGIIVGVMITLYTFILPFTIEAFTGSSEFVEYGPFGVGFLKPQALFGVDFLDPTAHAFFWSMTFNILCYFYFSLSTKGNYRERNFAEIFVDPKNYSSLQDNALVWKGEAYVKDIKRILTKFIGVERTNKALAHFFEKYDLPGDTQMADARLINFSERMLAGSIGGASAKILISSVVKEEEISLIEVLQILEESKKTIETNKLLKDKSVELANLATQLRVANTELLKKDQQKDEFLDTVAHELKTPITGIRASAELLHDDIEEMPEEMRMKFLLNILQDSDRLARLINHILDYEKLSNGRGVLDLKCQNIQKTLRAGIDSAKIVADRSGTRIDLLSQQDIVLYYDEDRLLQVLTNLLSNAIKYARGLIEVNVWQDKCGCYFSVADNGEGVADEDVQYIFDKFFQSHHQNTIKPSGSGFGLAICKQIVDKHEGEIWYEPSTTGGAKIIVRLPIKNREE